MAQLMSIVDLVEEQIRLQRLAAKLVKVDKNARICVKCGDIEKDKRRFDCPCDNDE